MFETLHIQGYRRFKDYRLENLARVNLLVGDNNSGKTSVLEAVFLLAMNDPHDVFRMIAARRGEQVNFPSERNLDDGGWYPTLKHCWADHDLSPGRVVRVESSERWIHVEALSVEDTPHNQLAGRFQQRAVQFQSNTDSKPLYFGIDYDGVFDRPVRWDKRARLRSDAWLLDAESTSSTIRQLWDAAVYAGIEERVIDALRMIADDVDRLHFDGIVVPPRNPRVGIKVRSSNHSEMQPIGSYGQGVYRALELALYLIASKNSVFLIDEIDNGFHWTRMADIWRFIIRTAKETNTQVFATTHSEDCIRGLDWVCTQSPELAQEVSVQTLKENLDRAIALPGERLPEIMRSEIEVR